MRHVVADASTLVEYLLRTPREAAIGEIVGKPDVAIHVPALCHIEVAAVVRRALNVRRRAGQGRADAHRVEGAVATASP